jgi:hypothetical protein
MFFLSQLSNESSFAIPAEVHATPRILNDYREYSVALIYRQLCV